MDESDRMCADLDLCNSERDALRKEVERYKREALTETIGKLLCHVPMPYNIQGEIKAWRDRQIERRKAQ
jgi:hypothetical protein